MPPSSRIPLVVDAVSGKDDRWCSGEPRDLCESLELSIVQIGPETAEIRVRNETEIVGGKALARPPALYSLDGSLDDSLVVDERWVLPVVSALGGRAEVLPQKTQRLFFS